MGGRGERHSHITNIGRNKTEEELRLERQARDQRAVSRASQRENTRSRPLTPKITLVPSHHKSPQHVEHEDGAQKIAVPIAKREQFNFGSLLPSLLGHLTAPGQVNIMASHTMLLKRQMHKKLRVSFAKEIWHKTKEKDRIYLLLR